MKRLGLDIGSSSIGWALRENNLIIQKGVITFQSGMIKGQSGYSSPTKDRREARSKRRLIQSKKYRKFQLLKILQNEFVPLDEIELENWIKYKKGKARKFPENENFLKWLSCDFTYLENGVKYKNPYELRVKALDEKLGKHELGRALYHLVQRRGYKDIGETDAETEKQKERRKEGGFQKALDKTRTIAEALKKEFLDKGERARNQYPYRDEYEKELLLICQAQNCDNDFIQKLRKAIIWQRDLRSQKGNIGKCTLESDKPRCPVSHPAFEIFRAWCFINTIKYFDVDGIKQSIPHDLRNELFKQLFLKKDKNFKFEEIRRFIDKHFKRKGKYNYPYNKEKDIYDSSVAGMPVCSGLIKLFRTDIKDAIAIIETYNIGNAPKIINGYSIYDLWHIIFVFDKRANKTFLKNFANTKLKIENEKSKSGDEYNPVEKLKDNFQSGYADLSLKAINKVIPFLKEGYLYNEAVLLAKIPELLGEDWKKEKESIKSILQNSNDFYQRHKIIIDIANNLIDTYKGLEAPVFGYQDFEYSLDKNDISDILNASISYFGENSWQKRTDQEEILLAVKKEYESFFHDAKRAYRKVPTLTDIFEAQLSENRIHVNGELYHHSNKENIYGEKIKDKKTGMDMLPEPRIDSIKNPMFNKAMNILRKLINELIVKEIIDEDTEIVIEIARELNDNNKRAAIERYQRERETKREKYREFLKEFKEKEQSSVNVEESITTFELWTEQAFEQAENERKEKVTNINSNEILKEKEAIKRYELWMEQKGQCLYTGKMISITQLFSNEIDIEHTIPRSLLPDNTMANQTVCYAKYNRDIKNNQIPFNLDNYDRDWNNYSAILPRLKTWIDIRDDWKERFEKNLKPKGNEDEENKNKRIQAKHYHKMHYDYWHDKIERFINNEIKDSWARRQLTDTQMISKFAREFLKTYFKKVAVQKGSVTADFRKMYSFQEEDEIKNRNKHTHHAIDAAVLTLIPTNSSYRDKLLKKMYEISENEKRQYTENPFQGFNSQVLINDIENNTLIVNYEKDKILKQTYRNVRKRGRFQYLNNNGNEILLKTKGDTIRSSLYAATYLGKIKDVERYDDGRPKREDGDWKYKTGKEEFIFVKKENIDKVKASDKLIDAIVDPVIKEAVRSQKNTPNIRDHQRNIIRHVRIKTSTGKEVKERANYRSKYDYKNKFYSESGSLPYAILLQNSNNSTIEHEMIPIASFEISKVHKKNGRFDMDEYIKEYHPEHVDYPDKKLLKVGQKVIVLKDDKEYEKRFGVNFLTKRLYVISQFSEGSIWMKYHLEARSKDEIKNAVNIAKDKKLREYEMQFGIPEILEDNTIEDNRARKEDFEYRKYRFDTLKMYRFKKLSEKIGIEKVKEIKNELDKFKAISSIIEIEGQTPLLKMSKDSWNYLYEGYDFAISMLGEIKWLNNNY
jgi:CRISPR-associated endonuclease Csn1